MTVLDTSFLVDLIRKDPVTLHTIKEYEERDEDLCTTVINSLELIRGVYCSSQRDQNKREVNAILSALNVLNIDQEVQEIFGKISSDCFHEGCTIGDFDELIAAICISHNQRIITRNSHFNRIPGLSVIQY